MDVLLQKALWRKQRTFDLAVQPCLISPQDLGRQAFRLLAIVPQHLDLFTILAFEIAALSP